MSFILYYIINEHVDFFYILKNLFCFYVHNISYMAYWKKIIFFPSHCYIIFV